MIKLKAGAACRRKGGTEMGLLAQNIIPGAAAEPSKPHLSLAEQQEGQPQEEAISHRFVLVSH